MTIMRMTVCCVQKEPIAQVKVLWAVSSVQKEHGLWEQGNTILPRVQVFVSVVACRNCLINNLM